MSKPKSMPAPGAEPEQPRHQKKQHQGNQEPLSGSKKVKNRNHVSHHNTEG